MLHFAHTFNIYGKNFNVKTKTVINGLYNSTSGGQRSAKRRCHVEEYTVTIMNPAWKSYLQNLIYS